MTSTPNRPPAVAARTAARASTRPRVSPAAPRIAEGDRGRVAARAGGRPGDREPQPDQRAEDQEQPQVGGRGDAPPHRCARPGPGSMAIAATTAATRPTSPMTGRRPLTARRTTMASPANAERDDDEGEQAHRGGSGWVSRAVTRPMGGRSAHREPVRAVRAGGGRQDRHGTAERRHEPGGQELLELVGRAAQARPGRAGRP